MVVGAQEIRNVFELPPTAVSSRSDGELTRTPKSIVFQRVSVRYARTDQYGLKAIDLTISKGERIAVVGQSGSGKSTLIHLLLGFIAPTSGHILVDDRTLEEVDISDWRHQCAWIGQHPMIFAGTLRENIAMSRIDASTDQIETAARQAGVMEFSDRWEMGLNTMVGEQGLGLSVGQAQRIALARAIIQDAPLLLLDEPTASLDRETETAIISDIATWIEGRTAVIATHRPAALTLADRILLLQNGKLIAQGDYNTLVQTHGELLPKM